MRLIRIRVSKGFIAVVRIDLLLLLINLVMQQNCRYEINQLSNVVFFFSLDSGIEFLEELIGMPNP